MPARFTAFDRVTNAAIAGAMQVSRYTPKLLRVRTGLPFPRDGPSAISDRVSTRVLGSCEWQNLCQASTRETHMDIDFKEAAQALAGAKPSAARKFAPKFKPRVTKVKLSA